MASLELFRARIFLAGRYENDLTEMAQVCFMQIRQALPNFNLPFSYFICTLSIDSKIECLSNEQNKEVPKHLVLSQVKVVCLSFNKMTESPG